MMERRFDMSDFEQSLKDHADQFTMVPSRRIWNGIYNNLHPGSKWPSIAVGIVFIITLFTIGFFNNSSKKKSSEVVSIPASENVAGNFATAGNLNNSQTGATSGRKTYDERNVSPEKNNHFGLVVAKENLKQGEGLVTAVSKKEYKTFDQKGEKVFSSKGKNTLLNNNGNILGIEAVTNSVSGETTFQNTNENKSDEVIAIEDFNSFLAADPNTDIEFVPLETDNVNDNQEFTLATVPEDFSSSHPLSVSSPLETRIHPLNKTINQSKKGRRAKNKNIEWIYYVTPAVSTPIFRNSSLVSSVNFSPLAIFQNASSNGMIYHGNFGFEVGAKITYTLSKKWKVFSGFNLNYSDYGLISNLLHPTFATLNLKDRNTGIPYSKSYITFYGNGQSFNQVDLTNYSVQVLIPLGLEYQIWGNKNIQLSIASAIEPSLVLKSNSYIISADKKYYVQDPSLMRRVNLGGNFGTFISFGSNKIRWHIGPDIHYQILSTYKNSYLSEEHLVNYGIRIGISKKY